MGASLQGRPSSKGKRRRANHMAEINVTPFVDVMLVLLIIFMVAAPLMTAGVAVDLPQSNAAALTEDKDKPIQVSIDDSGAIFVDEDQVQANQLIPVLQGLSDGNTTRRIYIRGDKSLPYGQVMVLMGEINKAGFTKVALVSEQK